VQGGHRAGAGRVQGGQRAGAGRKYFPAPLADHLNKKDLEVDVSVGFGPEQRRTRRSLQGYWKID
jgi:hypothetical protein